MSAAAAAPAIKLKVRTPAGDKLVHDASLSKQSTLLQLQQHLQQITSIPVAEQQLSTTYPPPGHVLEGPDFATLAELKISSGDVLLLKRMAPPTASTAAVAAPPAASQRPVSPPKPAPATLQELQHLRPLSVQPIANDNSCLFNAVGGLVEGFHACGPALVTELRQTVASIISANSDGRYSEGYLGAPPDKYTRHILQPDTWGGGIELSVLAEFHDVEIAALDVETCHQYIFGESADPKLRKTRRIYLVYSGVHYDALEERHDNGQPPTRIFRADDELAASRALLAVRQLQAAGSFTNVAKSDTHRDALNEE